MSKVTVVPWHSVDGRFSKHNVTTRESATGFVPYMSNDRSALFLVAIQWQLLNRLAIGKKTCLHIAQRSKFQWLQLLYARFQLGVHDQISYQAQGCAQVLLHRLIRGSALHSSLLTVGDDSVAMHEARHKL